MALSPTVDLAGSDAPWLVVGTLLAILPFGSPQLLIFLALGLAPLLAGLSTYASLRRFEVPRTTSAIAAGTQAGAVTLLGLVTAGDVAGMMLAIVLPQLASTIHRMAIDDSLGAEWLRASASAAAWPLIGVAAWPVLLTLAIVGGIIWIIRDRFVWLPVLITLVLPVALLVPWVPSLIAYPSRLLTGPDPLAWPAWTPASLATLFGRILPFGLPLWVNIVFSAVLGVAAGYAICTIRGTSIRLLSIAGIGFPLVVGVVPSRIVLPVNGGETWALLTGWALLTVAGLLTPIVAMRLRDEKAGVDLCVLLACLSTVLLLMAGVWAVISFAGPVSNHPSGLSFARGMAVSKRRTRVLMIKIKSSGGLRWNVVDSSQPSWGTAERNPAGAFHDDFAALVQLLGGGDAPENLVDRLQEPGVSHAWTKGFSTKQLAAVGNTVGLTCSPVDGDTVIWTVVELPFHLRIVDENGSKAVLDGNITAAEAERRLVLAETPDDRWRVRINGQELTPLPEGGKATSVVPAGPAGKVTWGMAPAWWMFSLQVGVVVLIIGLAAPTIGDSSGARRGLED